jgi:branched-chain amino acid transport system permease protein
MTLQRERSRGSRSVAFDIFIANFLQALATGILVGGVYALMSIGLALIFGIMRVINFAQGDFLMLGMYAAWYLVVGFGVLAFLGPIVGPLAGAFLAGPILFAFAYLLHRLLISRVTGTRRGGQDAQLILTLGISLVLANLGLIVFGSFPQSIRTPLSTSAWEIGPVFVNQARGVAFVVAVLLAIGLYLFLNNTAIGKSLRAAADNPEAATYMGIDVDLAHRIAFSVGIALTAIAGGLVATYYQFQPYVGLEFVVIMYVSVVLGGLGSTVGAFFGGLIIGLVQQLWPVMADVLGIQNPIQLQNAVIFLMFLLIVYLRPQGFFGRFATRT